MEHKINLFFDSELWNNIKKLKKCNLDHELGYDILSYLLKTNKIAMIKNIDEEFYDPTNSLKYIDSETKQKMRKINNGDDYTLKHIDGFFMRKIGSMVTVSTTSVGTVTLQFGNTDEGTDDGLQIYYYDSSGAFIQTAYVNYAITVEALSTITVSTDESYCNSNANNGAYIYMEIYSTVTFDSDTNVYTFDFSLTSPTTGYSCSGSVDVNEGDVSSSVAYDIYRTNSGTC